MTTKPTAKPKPKLRVRRELISLQQDYEAGNKKPLEDLMRAWKFIKELPADDERSFLRLADTTANRSAALVGAVAPIGEAIATTVISYFQPGTAFMY